MNQPPPLPVPGRKVHRAVFKKNLAIRMGDIQFDYGLIEQTHKQAEDWINQNIGIRVISIETYHSAVMAVTVVWYEKE